MYIGLVGPVAQSVQWLATGWTVRGSNPGGGQILRSCPDRPWGPPSLLCNGYRVFPGSKERPGRDAKPPPPHPSNAEVLERVEPYLYSPYGPYGLYRASVPVQRCTVRFFYTGLLVIYPLFLSDPNDTWIFSKYFRKIIKYNKNPSCGGRLFPCGRAEGWTNGHTERSY